MLRRKFLKFLTCGTILSFFGLQQAKADLKKGDIVRIKNGSYKGKIGKIHSLFPNGSKHVDGITTKTNFSIVEINETMDDFVLFIFDTKDLTKL